VITSVNITCILSANRAPRMGRSINKGTGTFGIDCCIMIPADIALALHDPFSMIRLTNAKLITRKKTVLFHPEN